MRLLEREHALASMREYVGSAASGDGRLVLVSGEAGVGKSTLLECFEAATHDLRWLHGACDGLFTPRPLGPLFDVAEELGGELLAGCRRDAPREELFRHLLHALAEGDGARVLAIEDIHWADESTLDLLGFLGRRVRDTNALVICTYRDDEIGPDHPLRLVLGELSSARSTRRVGLARLSEQAVCELAAGSDVDARELYRLSGGNPFFVTEVLQARSTELPESARDAVLARLARVAPAARRVAEAAALLGTHVESSLLDAVAAPTAQELDDLVVSGLLVSDRDGLRFRHEIARLAVERGVPAYRRSEMHGRALAALQARSSEDAARLAYHAEGADDAAAVLRFAPAAAARASSLGSHREAAAQYERALRFAAGADSKVVADLHIRLADEYSVIDRVHDAAEVLEQALGLWRGIGDRVREGDTLRRLAGPLWRLCRGQEAVAASQAALSVLEPLGPGPELAQAYLGAAGLAAQLGDAERCFPAARRAQDLAADLDLPLVASMALNTEAYLTAALGGDWLPTMQRALQIGFDADLPQAIARAYANMVEQLVAEFRLAEAEHYYSAGIAYCNQHDMDTYATCLRGHHADAVERVGRWDEAAATCELMLATTTSPVNRLNALITLGSIKARRGDLAAWSHLDEALESAIGTAERTWLVPTRIARAEAHWLQEELAAARSELAAAYPLAAGWSAWARGSLTSWLRRTGAAEPPPPGPLPEPHALALAGRFAMSAAAWDRLGCTYEAALAMYDSGTEDGLREAIRRFEALGATAAVEAARREMRRLGIRRVPSGARATTRAHPLGLTRRESEVLEGICAGRTNAEISAELFISERTVDHHVSAVLAKLGVPSRGAAAAEAQRRGLVPSRPGSRR